MRTSDTIVAISSATASESSPAARMIVRLAGPGAETLLDAFFVRLPGERFGERMERPAALDANSRSIPAPSLSPANAAVSTAIRRHITIDGLSTAAWIYTFHAPRSYTGDDLIELHLPGSALLAQLAVDQLIAAGARMAEPGEFTARAFLNGRLDLAAAEGVAMAISAKQRDELRAARQLMGGELSRRLTPHLESLAQTLALLETGIDFSDQDVSFIDAAEVRRRAAASSDDLLQLLNDSPQIERLGHRPRFVLMGKPNVGKSTLLNALSHSCRAVVSDIAGTTRDTLAANVSLRRGIVEVIDVAGLESTGGGGAIQKQMQSHAARAITEADFVIHVVSADGLDPLDRRADLIVVNKMDLIDRNPAIEALAISALRGEGLDGLRDAMDALAFGIDISAGRLALTSRHRAAIDETIHHLAAAAAVAQTPELAAHDLRAALDSLGQVLGQVTPDDVLGRVFAAFCIGK